jgi:hypothetical protein
MRPAGTLNNMTFPPFRPDLDDRSGTAAWALLRSTEQLRASKQAKYVQQEQVVFETLCELWPTTETA